MKIKRELKIITVLMLVCVFLLGMHIGFLIEKPHCEYVKETVPTETLEEPLNQMQEVATNLNIKNLGKFKITYYCPCKKCCGKTDGITASGAKAVAGTTIAVPKTIPFGTKLVVNGHTYIAQDRGGSIKGNRIDIFVKSHKEALQKGVTYANVYKVV